MSFRMRGWEILVALGVSLAWIALKLARKDNPEGHAGQTPVPGSPTVRADAHFLLKLPSRSLPFQTE
jgi:hypothetical protein